MNSNFHVKFLLLIRDNQCSLDNVIVEWIYLMMVKIFAIDKIDQKSDF